MSRNNGQGYTAPDITEYGDVEDITEYTNKSELGTDSDHEVINLRGSTNI